MKAWRVVTFFPGLGGSELNRSLTRALAEQLPELRSSATALDDIANGLAKDAPLTVKLSIEPAFARAADRVGCVKSSERTGIDTPRTTHIPPPPSTVRSEDSSEGCASDLSLRVLGWKAQALRGVMACETALEPTSGGGRETVPTEPAS